ncbi:MAG TPA: hypothetical protein VJG85_01605 [Patescibacteria group bacterium]|nr:hypothetical protein [Patescibacteria group bacterium]
MGAVKFICPNDGELVQEDVIFLCNNCKQDELIFKNGMYICPACLYPGENFECMLCGSKEVKAYGLKASPSDPVSSPHSHNTS